MEHRVIGILRGKAATEIVRGVIDMGSHNDISRAFRIVERFVERLCTTGFETFERGEASETVKEIRDRGIASEIERYYRMANKVILENKEFLYELVDLLMLKTTLQVKK